MKDHVFIVEGRGDMSVGIFPSHFEIVLKNFNRELEADEIENIKMFFIEFDDNNTTVYTAAEYDAELNAQKQEYYT